MAFLDDPYRAAMRASIRGYKLPGTKGQKGGPGAPRSPYESYLQPRLNGRMASMPSAGVSAGAAYKSPTAATAAGSGWLGGGWLGDPNPEEWNPLGDNPPLPPPPPPEPEVTDYPRESYGPMDVRQELQFGRNPLGLDDLLQLVPWLQRFGGGAEGFEALRELLMRSGGGPGIGRGDVGGLGRDVRVPPPSDRILRGV